MARERKLLSPLGVFVCTLTSAEAESMERHGKIRKAGKASYVQTCAPQPSSSRESKTSLTGGTMRNGDGGDMHKLAGNLFVGGRLNQRDRERFLGWAERRAIPVTVVSAIAAPEICFAQ